MAAQNLLSLLSEQITALPALRPLAELISAVEDEYHPGAPPLSPLTRSYFTCWALCDAAVGPARETVSTCILDAASLLRLPEAATPVVRMMAASRMGFYVVQALQRDGVALRELITGSTCLAVVPSGYHARPGELWFARVLPPPFGASRHVVFTTPYVIRAPSHTVWQAYLARLAAADDAGSRAARYADILKYGPMPSFWHEFLRNAYQGYRTEAIWLEGLPRGEGGAAVRSNWARPRRLPS